MRRPCCWNGLLERYEARHAAADRAGVGLEPSTMEHFVVTMSESDLSQVLDVLLDNAIKYAGRGARVSLGCTAGTITVADDGPGMPPEDRGRRLARAGRPGHPADGDAMTTTRRAVLLAWLAALAGCSSGYSGPERELRIAAGEEGGFYLAFARLLAERITQDEPRLRCTALATQASQANVELYVPTVPSWHLY